MRFLSYLFRLSTSYSVLRDGPLRNNRIQTFNIKLKINQSKEIMPYENHFICTWYRTRCRRSTHQLLLQKLQPSYSQDRKSTRLNSSHVSISYAVFCLKKKK